MDIKAFARVKRIGKKIQTKPYFSLLVNYYTDICRGITADVENLPNDIRDWDVKKETGGAIFDNITATSGFNTQAGEAPQAGDIIQFQKLRTLDGQSVVQDPREFIGIYAIFVNPKTALLQVSHENADFEVKPFDWEQIVEKYHELYEGEQIHHLRPLDLTYQEPAERIKEDGITQDADEGTYTTERSNGDSTTDYDYPTLDFLQKLFDWLNTNKEGRLFEQKRNQGKPADADGSHGRQTGAFEINRVSNSHTDVSVLVDGDALYIDPATDEIKADGRSKQYIHWVDGTNIWTDWGPAGVANDGNAKRLNPVIHWTGDPNMNAFLTRWSVKIDAQHIFTDEASRDAFYNNSSEYRLGACCIIEDVNNNKIGYTLVQIDEAGTLGWKENAVYYDSEDTPKPFIIWWRIDVAGDRHQGNEELIAYGTNADSIIVEEHFGTFNQAQVETEYVFTDLPEQFSLARKMTNGNWQNIGDLIIYADNTTTPLTSYVLWTEQKVDTYTKAEVDEKLEEIETRLQDEIDDLQDQLNKVYSKIYNWSNWNDPQSGYMIPMGNINDEDDYATTAVPVGIYTRNKGNGPENAGDQEFGKS